MHCAKLGEKNANVDCFSVSNVLVKIVSLYLLTMVTVETNVLRVVDMVILPGTCCKLLCGPLSNVEIPNQISHFITVSLFFLKQVNL